MNRSSTVAYRLTGGQTRIGWVCRRSWECARAGGKTSGWLVFGHAEWLAVQHLGGQASTRRIVEDAAAAPNPDPGVRAACRANFLEGQGLLRHVVSKCVTVLLRRSMLLIVMLHAQRGSLLV